MSAPAISPAPSPAPNGAGSANGGAQGAQGQKPPQGFDKILIAMSDGQVQADAAAAAAGTRKSVV